MSLPQIQEMDPWLEEDEEVFMNSGIECRKELHVATRKQNRSISFTGLVTNLAKISFYSYLFCKVLSKSTFAKTILKYIANNSARLGGLSTAFIVLISFLFKRLQKKFN